MGIRPQRVDVPDRATGIGKVLLTDKHERPVRHPPGMDIALGGGDLGVAAAEVDGSRLARVRIGPGHAALDREVDLEGAGTVTEAPETAGNPRRQPITEDVGDRAGGEVEHRHVRRRQLRRRLDPHTGLDLAAEIAKQRHQRVGDRLRAARPRPASRGGGRR